jgi:hypothetical protein
MMLVLSNEDKANIISALWTSGNSVKQLSSEQYALSKYTREKLYATGEKYIELAERLADEWGVEI